MVRPEPPGSTGLACSLVSQMIGFGGSAGSNVKGLALVRARPMNRRKLFWLLPSKMLRSSFFPWKELGRMYFSPNSAVLLVPSTMFLKLVLLLKLVTMALAPLLLNGPVPLTAAPLTVPDGIEMRMAPSLLAVPATLA